MVPRPRRAQRRFGWGTLIAVALIMAAGGFVVGTRSEDILAVVKGSQNITAVSRLDFSSLQDVYDKLRQEFDGKLDATALINGAKKGLVDAAGDPYTVYFTDTEASDYLDALDGRFSGIGAELDKKDGALLVVSTLDGSPARKAGLLAKDAIVKVNDEETTGWSIDKAVSKIRGEEGTTVKLTIVRHNQLKEFSIVRAKIINPSVKYEISADNIGYVRLSRFADTDTAHLMKAAATEFHDKKVRGVVLDLRGNGGGYLKAAQEVASLWLDEGQMIVEERRGDTTTDALRAEGGALLKGVPTVVLIDSGSASASEILAGALHDHHVAQLVGVKSFGKGSVQQIVEIDSGGQLKVTIAKWFTPAGVNISKEGIKPDVSVTLSDSDIAKGHDRQKEKAFEILLAK